MLIFIVHYNNIFQYYRADRSSRGRRSHFGTASHCTVGPGLPECPSSHSSGRPETTTSVFSSSSQKRGAMNILDGGQIPAVQIGSRGLETARVVIRIQPGSLESVGRPFPWFQMARVRKKGLFWSTRRDQAIRTLVLPFPQFQSGKAKDSTPRAMWSPLPRRGEAILGPGRIWQ